jgi:hypothetical protein
MYAQTKPIDTDGDGYYNISTLEELRWVSENSSSWDWNFELDNDIDASDTRNWNVGNHDNDSATPDEAMGWSPIGTSSTKDYERHFLGHGYTISNLYINRPLASNIGFIGWTDDGTVIENLKLKNVEIIGKDNTGGIVGNNDYGIIVNCFVSGEVYGNLKTGGVVGQNGYGLVGSCASEAEVYGEIEVGGVVGRSYYATVRDSYGSKDVTGIDRVGGLIGYVHSGTVRNCYSKGIPTADSTARQGGMIGYNYDNPTIADSYWDTETSGTSFSNGGEGKTSAFLKSKANLTYNSWNFFALWDIDPNVNSGHPYHNNRTIEETAAVTPVDTDSDGLLNISELGHLVWITKNMDGYSSSLFKYYELDNDIDASPTKYWKDLQGFTPIGYSSNRGFERTFDGHGYTIDSLYISRSLRDNTGFIGGMEGDAHIKDINFTNAIVHGKNNTGIVVGASYEVEAGEVTNCFAGGFVKGKNYVGGIIGHHGYGLVGSCVSDVEVYGEIEVGGVVGRSYYATVRDSYGSKNVIGIDRVGGLIGYVHSGIVRNCYSKGIPTADSTARQGGMIGYNYDNPTIADSYWDTEISGTSFSNGGDGKTSVEMKDESTYSNWDFSSIWDIKTYRNGDYPYLQWQKISNPIKPTDTDGDGYINIKTLGHLRWVSENDSSWTWNFELDNDIDAIDTRNWNSDGSGGNYGWYPIGNSTTKFTGNFDGHGYEIKNIFINRMHSNNIGFFGYTSGAEIESLILLGCDITGNEYVAGLVGYNLSSDILDCSTSGTIVGKGSQVGGLIAFSYTSSNVNNCFSSCSVTGNGHNIGAFMGYNHTSTVSSCYSTGNVSGTLSGIGGLVGANYEAVISNCYSTGSVNGNTYVGGLVGDNYNACTITNCYSIGTVNGTSYTGGLIGRTNPSASTQNSYWDTQTSLMSSSAGGTGKTTAELKNQSTFTNWDYKKIWAIDANENNGYPYLKMLNVQVISLNQGWNLISSNLIPEDNGIDKVLGELGDDFLICRGDGSSIYFPKLNLNTIYNWDYTKAYKVYMNQAADLEIVGNPIPDGATINLQQGWNTMAFMMQDETDITVALAGIANDLLIVRDGSGKIYFPFLNLNQIETLKPGEGYLIYMKNSATLDYPN